MPSSRFLVAFIPLALAGVAPHAAWSATVDAGALRAERSGGRIVLSQPGDPDATLTLTGARPTRVRTTVTRVGAGLIRIRLQAPPRTPRTSVRFARAKGERFLGFGERSDAVVRSSGSVQNRVTEGPYQDAEEPAIASFVPAAGFSTRSDATYFPIPWVLSTRGYGVLVEDDPTSTHRLGSPWSVEIEGDRLTLLVVAGPRPRDVLRRFSAHVGRQPAVRPEALGPWWQPPGDGGLSDEQQVARLRRAGALGSVVQTYTHYLPCADHVGQRDAERRRVAAFARAGLVTTTYFNPMLCTNHPRYAEAREGKLLTRTPLGTPYEYKYTGSARFLVGQLDFRAPGAGPFWKSLLKEAVADGHAGWMEDFGEYTPDDARSAGGKTGSGGHNAYVRDYHAAAQAAVGDRKLLRFVRSGFTRSAKSSPIVWGGDPSTSWGFDGLESAVRNGLSMGLSGVSRWGSDIGGYFAISEKQTSAELLNRWIQVGFASGIMRMQANGFDLSEELAGRRAQITDPKVLPVWARYARLRTRMLPEIERAERAYDDEGLPIMRALALAYPDDPRAVERDDQWLLGDDLLVAPVLRPGATSRRVYLPRGRWVDLWRSADGELRRLRRPRILNGGREVTLRAPADELPLLVRLGSSLELLPDGGPSWREAVAGGAARRTILAFGARTVRLSGERRRRYDLQWTVTRRPRSLKLDGREVPFRYADGIVRATVRASSGSLRLR